MTTRTNLIGVRTVAVPVSNQETALAFYTDRLGFQTRVDVSDGGRRWIEVAPTSAGTTLALVEAAGGGDAGIDTGIRLSSRDASADHDAFTARGVDVGEVLRWDGVPPMFSLRDPDGNVLYVIEEPTAGV